jgi:hypothetical protein
MKAGSRSAADPSRPREIRVTPNEFDREATSAPGPHTKIAAHRHPDDRTAR